MVFLIDPMVFVAFFPLLSLVLLFRGCSMAVLCRSATAEPPASPGMPQLRMFSWDFGSDFAPVKPTQGGPIGALPVKAQEYRLIKDLLNCMIGCDGVSIHSRLDPHGKRVFSIDDTADVSLREIAGRILPLCASYSTVMRFAEGQCCVFFPRCRESVLLASRHFVAVSGTWSYRL
ncbi:hypothetical protein ISCGN_009990 [Ixodes scapularis]